MIRRYGTSLNWDTATFEAFHKIAVRQAFERDNHKDGMEDRLAQYAIMWSLIMTVLEEEIPDPVVRPQLIFPSSGIPTADRGSIRKRKRNPLRYVTTLQDFVKSYDSKKKRSAIRKAVKYSSAFEDVYIPRNLSKKDKEEVCIIPL